MYPAEIGDYKGMPTITLRWKKDDRFPFTFGKVKARLIIANLEEIKKFAAT